MSVVAISASKALPTELFKGLDLSARNAVALGEGVCDTVPSWISTTNVTDDVEHDLPSEPTNVADVVTEAGNDLLCMDRSTLLAWLPVVLPAAVPKHGLGRDHRVVECLGVKVVDETEIECARSFGYRYRWGGWRKPGS